MPVEQPPTPQTYRWTFERPPTPDLVFIHGQVKWLPEAIIPDPSFTLAFAKAKLPSCAFVLTTRSIVITDGITLRFAYGAALYKQEQRLTAKASRTILHTPELALKSDRRSYFVGRYMIEYLDNTITRVDEYDEDHANLELGVGAESLRISEFELRPILNDADLPPELRDIPKLISGMAPLDRKPQSK